MLPLATVLSAFSLVACAPLSESVPGDSSPVDSATTPVEAEPPSLVFLAPEPETTNPVPLAVTATGPITQVTYFLDIVPIATATDPSDGFAAVWEADVLGEITLVARGYDEDGVELAHDILHPRILDLGQANMLGVWLEDNEASGFTHEELAQRLGLLGVKRIFIHTGGTLANCETYPAACDPSVPRDYHEWGISVFGYSTPVAGANGRPGTAVTYTSDVGYDGYVVLFDDEWAAGRGTITPVLSEFRTAVSTNQAIGRAPSVFPLYAATAIPPSAAAIDLLATDSLVDGWLPRVPVEEAGPEAVAHPGAPAAAVVCAWVAAGATQPLLPFVGTETGALEADGVDKFFAVAGQSASLWQVPPAADPERVWNTWEGVDWEATELPPSAVCP